MMEETRSPEEIERSLSGTRRRIEHRFEELSQRLHSRADAVPGWVKGAGGAALLYVLRRPLLHALRSAVKWSAPVLVPLVIGKVMERRRAYRDRELLEGEDMSYGEGALGEGRGWSDPSYSP